SPIEEVGNRGALESVVQEKAQELKNNEAKSTMNENEMLLKTVNNDETRSPNQSALECYQACNGNLSKTAKALGVSRNTLYKKLRELGLK
ncbi:MAG: helix-turn-helix domain-containing protein, partial [Oceanospirillaceae bacterium]